MKHMSALLPPATLFEQHPRGALIRRLYDDVTETGPNFDQQH
jgi:hypothetical protein